MGRQLKIVGKTFGVVEEKLSNASPSRPACTECGLHKTCNEPFIQPYVPDGWTGEYLFVIDVSANGEREIRRNGLFLSQLERAMLKRVLCQTGIVTTQVALCATVRCRPNLGGAKKTKMHSLRACRPFLLRTIAQLKPVHVVGFGDTSARALLNTGSTGPIAKLRGRTLRSAQLANPFMITVRMSSLLVDPHAATRLAEDLRRLGQPKLEYPKHASPSSKQNGRTRGCVAFDTEYTADVVHCVGIADAKNAKVLGKGAAAAVRGNTVIGHKIAVDLEALIYAKAYPKEDMELWLQGKHVRDTQLEARLADENRGKHGYKLESLLCSFYNVDDYKGPTETLGPDSSKWPKSLREERCRLDAWATYKVHEALQEQIEGPSKLCHMIAASLRRMYWTGIYISQSRYTKMRDSIQTDRDQSHKILMRYAKNYGMKDFVATNDNHVRDFVYNENGVGLEAETYTSGGLPTVSAKVLKEYKDNPAISALLQFSKHDKLLSTYTESLISKTVKTKEGLWLPVRINPLAARTGRRASEQPNLQNWPMPVRQIVVSRFKGGTIADNDYSKLEPILGGWVTGEEKLTEYFVKYPNGYIKIGEDFFKKSVDKTSSEYKAIKSLVLAILYKKQKWSLAEDLWVGQGVKLDSNYEKHTEKAGEILHDFLYKLFPGVLRYHQRQEEVVLSTGRVENALGQVRRLPLPIEPPKSEKWAYKTFLKYRARVINQAVNYPIQSLASYVTGCALVDLERALLNRFRLSYTEYQEALMNKDWPVMPLLCIEVHDDLVQDIPNGLEAETKEITHSVMQKPPTLAAELPELFDSNIKLTVDTNNGITWGMKG